MPLYHCKKCHHEWEAPQVTEDCDWCGGESYILQQETPLEEFIKYWGEFKEFSELMKIHFDDDYKPKEL